MPDGSFVAVPREGGGVPTFDLVEMGVPAITNTMTPVMNIETAKLKAFGDALDKGAVMIHYALLNNDLTIDTLVNSTKSAAGRQIMFIGQVDGVGVLLITINFNDTMLATQFFVLSTT